MPWKFVLIIIIKTLFESSDQSIYDFKSMFSPFEWIDSEFRCFSLVCQWLQDDQEQASLKRYNFSVSFSSKCWELKFISRIGKKFL